MGERPWPNANIPAPMSIGQALITVIKNNKFCSSGTCGLKCPRERHTLNSLNSLMVATMTSHSSYAHAKWRLIQVVNVPSRTLLQKEERPPGDQRLKFTLKKYTYLDYVLVRQRFVRLIVFGVLEQHLVHVRARVLVQFVATREDNQCDLTVAQHRQLVRLLHHAELPFVEGHLVVMAIKGFPINQTDHIRKGRRNRKSTLSVNLPTKNGGACRGKVQARTTDFAEPQKRHGQGAIT